MIWYRRLLPVIGNIRLLPGAAIGYTWPFVDVQNYGPTAADAEEELGASTKVLSGSGVTYSVGVELEVGVVNKNDNGVYISFDYRYRFGPTITASTRNDGHLFFPVGAEFDFEGHYFGLGVAWRVPM